MSIKIIDNWDVMPSGLVDMHDTDVFGDLLPPKNVGGSSERPFYPTTGHHIPEDSLFH